LTTLAEVPIILGEVIMGPYRIGEAFGHAVEDDTARAREHQARRWCPFRDAPCTKGGAADPLGVCSLTDGNTLAVVCPIRFAQDGTLFAQVGRQAFGPGVRIVAIPELQVLRVARQDAEGGQREHRVGKVDYLVARLDPGGNPSDFAALEVQAVYFSGKSLRPAFREFLRTQALPDGSERRPDWRSSAQKRLMPQLSLKVPVFRRWGKKFFVAIDSNFFTSLPDMRTVSSIANSEVTWVVCPFRRHAQGFALSAPTFIHSPWDDVITALRDGIAPDPAEILAEIRRKKETGRFPVQTT
jgi:hypothetical protein